jgi:putative membrane protein
MSPSLPPTDLAQTELKPADRISIELSSRRTGMSFQRTRMSADRTLMSVMRTAISLIGFGFTIFQVFGHLRDINILAKTSHAPRNFSIALVTIGIVMLALGIVYHLQYMRALRNQRKDMVNLQLIHGESPYPVSLTLLVAIMVLMLGLLAVVSMVFSVGPFD